jgi:hypothetical protein
MNLAHQKNAAHQNTPLKTPRHDVEDFSHRAPSKDVPQPLATLTINRLDKLLHSSSASPVISGPLAGLSAERGVTSAPPRIPLPSRSETAYSDVEVGLPRAEAPTALQKFKKIASYGVPAVDAVAAGLSLAASRLSVPVAMKVTGALSGSLWAGGAGASELCNSPRSYWASAANLLSAAAGALSAAAPFVSGNTACGAAYGSAGSWAANGTANMVRAAGDSSQRTSSRLLQGASGAANIAAAGLAAAAANASSNNDNVRAANLGTASSVLWAVGAAAATGAVLKKRSGTSENPPV